MIKEFLQRVGKTLRQYRWERIWFMLVLAIVVELVWFNRHAFLSMGADPTNLTLELSDSFELTEQGGHTLDAGRTGSISLSGMNGELSYLYLDIDCRDENGDAVPLTVKMTVQDEGNSSFYTLPEVTLFSDVKSTKYIRAHSYGDVQQMNLWLSADRAVHIWANRVVYDAGVPFDISTVRIALLFTGIILLWWIRPSSPLYEAKWSRRRKVILLLAVILANVAVWVAVAQINDAFVKPEWVHHQQYHKLAVALSNGEVSIPIGIEEEIAALANPYDGTLRGSVPNAFDGWDTAFYNGQFYVYFGLLPALLFYLPWYLLFGTAFPTWAGVLTMSIVSLLGIFYLMRQLVKHYFPKTPFLLYLILSVLVANSTGALMFLFRPDFYSLPILCALAFTVWGLGLWISAAGRWKTQQEGSILPPVKPRKGWDGISVRLLLGSLCMALVAACRAQFLMGSFLAFFIFGGCIKTAFKEDKRQILKRAIPALLPYVAVAAGVMYYNAIRFGSPFDFGANYNLTTNDMTLRGFNLGRLTDGLYEYLFQFPNIGAKFPFVNPTPFNSAYVGTTIRENMYGGVFFVNILLWALVAIRRVKDGLKSKKLLGMTVAMAVFAVVIAVADTQMAGLLSRYYTDFMWLFLLAAVMVVLQLWEDLAATSARRYLLLFVIASLLWSLFMQTGMGIQSTALWMYEPETYYSLEAFLT